MDDEWMAMVTTFPTTGTTDPRYGPAPAPAPLGPPNTHRRNGHEGRHGHDGTTDATATGTAPTGKNPLPDPARAREIFAELSVIGLRGSETINRTGCRDNSQARPRLRPSDPDASPRPCPGKENASLFVRARLRQLETRNRRNRQLEIPARRRFLPHPPTTTDATPRTTGHDVDDDVDDDDDGDADAGEEAA